MTNVRRPGIPAIPAMDDPTIYSTFQALRQVLVRLEDIARPLITGEWTAYTPKLTTLIGALSQAQASGRYIQMGRTVHFTLEADLTNIGTAGSALRISLPVGPARRPTLATVADVSTSSTDYLAYIPQNTSYIQLTTNASYSSPLASGRKFVITGVYEVA